MASVALSSLMRVEQPPLIGGGKSLGCEQRFQGRAIGLSGPASEVLNEELPHL